MSLTIGSRSQKNLRGRSSMWVNHEPHNTKYIYSVNYSNGHNRKVMSIRNVHISRHLTKTPREHVEQRLIHFLKKICRNSLKTNTQTHPEVTLYSFATRLSKSLWIFMIKFPNFLPGRWPSWWMRPRKGSCSNKPIRNHSFMRRLGPGTFQILNIFIEIFVEKISIFPNSHIYLPSSRMRYRIKCISWL